MKVNRGWYLAAIPILAAGLIAAARAANDEAAGEPDPPGLRIHVDLSARRLKMYEADTLVWQYPVAIGADGYSTPEGQYSIRKMVWNPKWVPPDSPWARKYTPKPPGHPANPMKVVKIFFKEPDYYLHGTADEKALGDPASHGCIRLSSADAYALARLLQQHGGAGKSEAWYRNAIGGKSTISVRLPKPVAIRIAA